ncbi:MAG: hypothetical protein ACJ8EK_03210 [Bradyrhizobium sp.]
MPVARYFGVVGGVLLTLMFFLNAFLPKLPDAAEVRAVDKSVIRIHSDRKWPERIVFDTSQPTLIPPQAAKSLEANVPAQPRVADMTGKARARDSLAELQPSDQAQAQLLQPKKLENKVVRKRKIARRAPPGILIAQQPQFGFFGNSMWHSTW